MRRHLSDRDALHHQAARQKHHALKRLAEPTTRKERRELIKLHDQAETIREQAEALDGSWDCSLCKKRQPEGKHVSAQIAGILAARGKQKRKRDDPEIAEGEFVDLPPLVKDYPPDKRPYLYVCHRCAVKAGLVTAEELAAGIRKDNLNED